MSVTFKKVLRKDPFHKDGTGKYYPQLIVWGKSGTLESIAVQMKESSSLTLGDIPECDNRLRLVLCVVSFSMAVR